MVETVYIIYIINFPLGINIKRLKAKQRKILLSNFRENCFQMKHRCYVETQPFFR